MATVLYPQIAIFTGILLVAIWVAYRLYLTYGSKFEGFANSAPYTFTMYYADWCGHCKTAKPEFMKLGSNKTVAGKIVNIVMVNPESNPEAVAGKDIKGYPTIQLTIPSGQVIEYSGPRSADGFVAFLNQNVR